jgi:predicted anti-sigma-YlaC factor YlaD
MANERTFRRPRAQHEDLSRASYIESCVDAAVAPLARYLNGWQTRLVRSIVQASIEADPVSRRLLANAIRTRVRSYGAVSRIKDGKAGRKKIRRF